MKPYPISAVSEYRKNVAGLAMALSILMASTVNASVIEGIEFKRELAHQGVELELKGTALLRYLVFIKAYVGAIYLPPEIGSDQALNDVPKRLEIEYFHPIEADGFRKATKEAIRRNVNEEMFWRVADRIDQLNALFRDVKPNDRYSLTYVPDQGTELALNGQKLGTIEGADFARSVFSIWIGAQPIDHDFKETILGAR